MSYVIGLKYTDIVLANQLRDYELEDYCLISKKLWQVCQSPEFWTHRIKERFGSKFLPRPNEIITNWHDYYERKKRSYLLSKGVNPDRGLHSWNAQLLIDVDYHMSNKNIESLYDESTPSKSQIISYGLNSLKKEQYQIVKEKTQSYNKFIDLFYQLNDKWYSQQKISIIEESFDLSLLDVYFQHGKHSQELFDNLLLRNESFENPGFPPNKFNYPIGKYKHFYLTYQDEMKLLLNNDYYPTDKILNWVTNQKNFLTDEDINILQKLELI